MKHFFTLTLLFVSFLANAQSTISGLVQDPSGKPLIGASVSLDNTIDGATSDSTGHFTFTTTEKGAQTLVATATAYVTSGVPVNVDANVSGIILTLKKDPRLLEAVTVSAGYEASNDKNKTILSTLDIVTTAGSQADVVRAIQTLPGTQQQGTQTGLFVRGGDASEAAVIIDGMVAQSAFFSGAPGVATRSRFSPFQFKGVSFSSGGYSARYGQALSSVLELNTLDLPDKSTINLGVNMAGVYASGQKLWEDKASIEGTASYNNLQPFYGLAATNVDYYDVPKGGGGSAKFTLKPNKGGLLKISVSGTHFQSGVTVDNPDSPGHAFNYGIKNTNVYTNASYRQTIKDKWTLFAGASYSYNKDNITAGNSAIEAPDSRAQLRLEAKRFFNTKLSVTVGGELQHFMFERNFSTSTVSGASSFTETQLAGYTEAEWSPAKWIAIRPGVRAEHSGLLEQSVVAPRLSIALRTSTYGQIGLASGIFYQTPDVPYLLVGYRPQMQEAIHYIVNYQWIKGDRTFRVEGYYKDYQSLILEHQPYYDPNSFRQIYGAPIDNSGHGYAKGAELFWRDKKSIKNADYWVSYSYIDTRRLYQNFLTETTPAFISDHNLSIIGKYYFPKLQTQVNATYSYASGRPYYNPSNPEFLADRTPEYHNLSFTVNYLTHVKKWFTVIYAGVDNVTNQKNVFGYRYSADGLTRYPQYPALFRSYFVGVNFSLTEFNKDEL